MTIPLFFRDSDSPPSELGAPSIVIRARSRVRTLLAKQPAEVLTLAIEFEDALPEDTTIASGTVAAIDLFTGDEDTSVISAETAVIDETQAKVSLVAGVSGKRYKITFLITFSDDQVLEEDVWVDVVER